MGSHKHGAADKPAAAEKPATEKAPLPDTLEGLEGVWKAIHEHHGQLEAAITSKKFSKVQSHSQHLSELAKQLVELSHADHKTAVESGVKKVNQALAELKQSAETGSELVLKTTSTRSPNPGMNSNSNEEAMKPPIYPILAALALTGCVGGISPKLSESHPANPQARPSPIAPAHPMLVAGSQGLLLPVSTNQTEMQPQHHQAPSKHKPAQKPAEHKHEHERPQKEEGK